MIHCFHSRHPFQQSNTKQKEVCINPYHYVRVESPVLPPVLVPRFSDPMPSGPLLPFQQIPEPQMPQNIYYNQNGFNSPPLHNHPGAGSVANPMSPGMSSGGVPSPGPMMSPYGPGSPQAHQGFDSGMSVGTGDLDQKPFGEPHHSMDTSNMQPVPYQEPQHWCSIAYYELNTRVGEMFHANGNRVQIDGFTNPGGNCNRFCIGQLSNVNRNSVIENTRRHIGQGMAG